MPYSVGTGALIPEVKRPRRGAIPSLSQYVFMAWCLIKQELHLHDMLLVKHREKFTFTILKFDPKI
jgi:hypothetical protein